MSSKNSSEFKKTVEQYNDCVKEWNNRYGSSAPLYETSVGDLNESLLTDIRKTVATNERTGKWSVKNTQMIVREFKSTNRKFREDEQMSKSELAMLIDRLADKILSECRRVNISPF